MTQKQPIETLAAILLERMNLNQQRSEKKIVNSDSYKYYNNFSKVRAIANIVLNNEQIYSNIIGKSAQSKLLVIKEPCFEISSMTVYNVNIHTEGDLILRLNNENSNIYFVGDILEGMINTDFSNLLSHPEISPRDSALLRTMLKSGNKLVTAHGKEYNVDASGNLQLN
jgi:hypothetical protein